MQRVWMTDTCNEIAPSFGIGPINVCLDGAGRGQRQERHAAELKNLRASGMAEEEAIVVAKRHVDAWVKESEAGLATRYERELMNPNEALSLGSISQIDMPSDLRKVIAENLLFHLGHYAPEPFAGVQREFH